MLAQLASHIRSSGDPDIGSGLDTEELRRMVTFANKAASLTCSRRGAIPAMPYADELN